MLLLSSVRPYARYDERKHADLSVQLVIAQGYVPPIATVVMVVIVPAALVLTSLLGLWPGHRAARLGVADALRAE